MLRTQVQLTEEQDRLLGELGRERRVSKAELVRRAVDLLLASEAPGRGTEEQRRRALAVAGRFRSGGRDGSRRHDAALAEAFAETGRRAGSREI
jgi:hypothetical protein